MKNKANSWVVRVGPPATVTDIKYARQPRFYGPFDESTAERLSARLNEIIGAQGYLADCVEADYFELDGPDAPEVLRVELEENDRHDKVFSQKQRKKFLRPL